MPFGLRNCPVVFIAMMHDLQELWVTMARQEGIDISNDSGTAIIMDDTFLFGVSIDNIFTLAKCICLIARKYHLTWKLKKSRWLPTSVEFVGVNIHANGGNTPAESKDILLYNWKALSTPREVLGIIGFAIFYLGWCPWFELKIKPLRAIISEHPLDYKFSEGDFDRTTINLPGSQGSYSWQAHPTASQHPQTVLPQNRFFVPRLRLCAEPTRRCY
jgi:hypothetical protein